MKPGNKMSKTPRTDEERKYSVIMVGKNHGLVHPLGTSHESSPKHYERTEMCRVDLTRQLETELTAKAAELEEAKRQMDSWLKEHDSQLRTARADAFDEAADMGLTVDDKWVQSGIDALSAEIHKKAASIRKGEEK